MNPMKRDKDSVYRTLDGLIPGSLSCDWDNDGYMIEAEGECRGILLTLDVTATAVDFASANCLDVIISHHPLIFRPLKTVSDDRIIKCVKNEIAVMSFHTRLDAREPGVNDALAEKIGLADTEPRGMLRVGTVPDSSLEDFARAVRKKLGAPHVRYAGNRRVSRAAVLGGAGKDFVSDAIALGCDTYITGEMGYNAVCDAADMGLNVIEAGHYYTERPVLGLLEGMISEIWPDLPVRVFESDPQRSV